MIFGESSFPAARQGFAQRRITRSKCPHCGRTISTPIYRLRLAEARKPLTVLAFE